MKGRGRGGRRDWKQSQRRARAEGKADGNRSGELVIRRLEAVMLGSERPEGRQFSEERFRREPRNRRSK
jgi:hypothetical protein